MPQVIDAQHIGGFRLSLRFADGTEGAADLTTLVSTDARPIVAALRDPKAFTAFTVDTDTVVWANGFDLAPEYLYAQVKSGATA